jgi:hypothetical protein
LEKTSGKEHLEVPGFRVHAVVRVTSDLAKIYASQGKYSEAEALLDKSLAVSERLSDMVSSTLTDMTRLQLADLHEAMKKGNDSGPSGKNPGK